MLLLSEVEKAYIAGIVDGEGTVTLSRRQKNKTPSPEVSIANCNLFLLQWIKKTLGMGRIMPKKKYSKKHRQSYTWRISSTSKVLALFEELKEFLIVKRTQAELITGHYKKVTPRNGRYTEILYKKKAALVSKVKKLNRR